MKEIREYLRELEKIDTDIINLNFYRTKTYQTLIDRIMRNCKTDIHPDVLLQLNKMKEINKVGYWVHNIKTKMFMGTKELLQFMGTDPKRDYFTEEEFFSLIYKDDFDRIQKSYPQDILAHEDRASAYRIITYNSELKFVVSHFSTKYDEHDNPTQVSGLIFEIPQVDNDIHFSYLSTKKEVISANMGVGFWEYDPQKNSEYWSSSLYEIIETTADKCYPQLSSLQELIDPPFLPDSLKVIIENNKENKDYEITLQIKTFLGNKKIVFSQVHHLVDLNGNLIKRYGLIYDVTKLKKLLL